MKKCKCDFCKTYDKFKWSEIINCKCSCHDGDGLTGHDGLCCSIPNGLKKNNPYTEHLDYVLLKNKMEAFESDSI